MPDRSRNAIPRWVLIILGWSVPAFLEAFNTYAQRRLNGAPPNWRMVLYNLFDWLLYAVLTPVVFRLSRRFPLVAPHLARRLGLHLAGAFLMSLAWAALGTALRFAMFPSPTHVTAARVWLSFLSWSLTTFPFGVGVYFALVGIEHSVFYLHRAREREMQAARLEAQLSDARLSALRMQINPHFLFNTLNAITVLMRDGDFTAASRMLELLSDVLHEVLRTEASHETALHAEVEFLERYLTIEQVRFSDRLRPHIEIAAGVENAAVPRFLLSRSSKMPFATASHASPAPDSSKSPLAARVPI